jgi:hypothetical protein
MSPEKLARLSALRQTAFPSGGALNTEKENNQNSVYINNKLLYTKERNEAKKARLSALQDSVQATFQSPQESIRPSPKGKPFEDVQFTSGWYQVGACERKVYRAEELLLWWRIAWIMHRREPAPPVADFGAKRQHVVKWLQEDNHSECEHIVSFAVEMWEVVANQFNIQCPTPEFWIIYAYRQSIQEMAYRLSHKEWGSHYVSYEETHAVQEASWSVVGF